MYKKLTQIIEDMANEIQQKTREQSYPNFMFYDGEFSNTLMSLQNKNNEYSNILKNFIGDSYIVEYTTRYNGNSILHHVLKLLSTNGDSIYR
jgi:hypothetical protein